jgi:flagellar basal-body rod protein FlgB
LARESLKQRLTLFIHHARMNIADIPLFAMLRGRLGYLSERQQVIAQNVANSDTPGFAPRDLKAFSFDASMRNQVAAAGVSLQAVTQPGHMTPPNAGKRISTYKTVKTDHSETTLDGNAVTLEEEMMKMTDARMSYDAAIGFYQKSLGMLRMATRAPGRG